MLKLDLMVLSRFFDEVLIIWIIMKLVTLRYMLEQDLMIWSRIEEEILKF